MLGRGLSRWWTLPLEMLSMCTCYSPRVHAIVGCIGDSSGTCHLLITQRSHLWLFLHVSGSCWTTCRVPGVPHVSFLLTHVSYWVTELTVHVLYFLFGHVSWRLPSTCRILIAHMSCPDYFTCHALVRPPIAFLFDHVAYLVLRRGVQSIHHKSNFRLSLLHRLTT
jgi:hypothetical protein